MNFSADSCPLGKILRYLASINVIQETGDCQYAANPVTHAFASEGGLGSVHC